jgi:hypothetical protein
MAARGLSSKAAALAAADPQSYWRTAHSKGINIMFSNSYLDELGLIRLLG